jgi:HSP20 family protein
MANIMRRTPRTELTRRLFDPFEMMREMMQMSPFGETTALRDTGMAEFLPAFEVRETEDAYIIRGDLPGIKEENVEISVSGNTLNISGHREEEERKESDRFHAYERRFGTFSRSFALPDAADTEHVRADLDSGVLTVSLPRRAEMKQRKVEINKKRAKG